MSQGTSNTNKTLNSFYKSLESFLNPITAIPAVNPALNHRIVGLNYETTIDKIIVVLGISWYKTKRGHQATEVIIIDHDDFQVWLQDNEAMQLDLGAIDDPDVHYLSYTEFMLEHCTREHFAAYIAEKELMPGYVWHYPKPVIGQTV